MPMSMRTIITSQKKLTHLECGRWRPLPRVRRGTLHYAHAHRVKSVWCRMLVCCIWAHTMVKCVVPCPSSPELGNYLRVLPIQSMEGFPCHSLFLLCVVMFFCVFWVLFVLCTLPIYQGPKLIKSNQMQPEVWFKLRCDHQNYHAD